MVKLVEVKKRCKKHWAGMKDGDDVDRQALKKIAGGPFRARTPEYNYVSNFLTSKVRSNQATWSKHEERGVVFTKGRKAKRKVPKEEKGVKAAFIRTWNSFPMDAPITMSQMATALKVAHGTSNYSSMASLLYRTATQGLSVKRPDAERAGRRFVFVKKKEYPDVGFQKHAVVRRRVGDPKRLSQEALLTRKFTLEELAKEGLAMFAHLNSLHMKVKRIEAEKGQLSSQLIKLKGEKETADRLKHLLAEEKKEREGLGKENQRLLKENKQLNVTVKQAQKRIQELTKAGGTRAGKTLSLGTLKGLQDGLPESPVGELGKT